MKIKALALMMIVAITFACKKKEVATDANLQSIDMAADTISTSGSQSQTVYACSMHPEVTGKADSKCPKCGMALTPQVGP